MTAVASVDPKHDCTAGDARNDEKLNVLLCLSFFMFCFLFSSFNKQTKQTKNKNRQTKTFDTSIKYSLTHNTYGNVNGDGGWRKRKCWWK